MKYKEALQKSLEKHNDIMPIMFGEFISNMGSILVWVADLLIREEMPDIYQGGEKIEDGQPRKPTLYDYIKVLSGKDFMRGAILSTQLQEFVRWLLEQEAETDDIEASWYDAEVLADKWNEYVKYRGR